LKGGQLPTLFFSDFSIYIQLKEIIMTDPQNNSNLAPWKRAIIGIRSTLVLALAVFGLYNLLHPKTSSTSTSTATPVATANSNILVAKQLSRQSEAKQYVSSINRAQQAFYAESATFSSTIEKLGIGIKLETGSYLYSIILNDNRSVQSMAFAKIDGLKNYTGIVYLIPGSDLKYTSTQTKLCESNQPSKELPGTPTATNSPEIQCPPGYSEVLR
jgi:type II secretory pathway pseudopilin PulG